MPVNSVEPCKLKLPMETKNGSSLQGLELLGLLLNFRHSVNI